MRPTPSFSDTWKRLHPGDHIKVEFRDVTCGESEWVWVLVESDDEEGGIAFGCLDNVPALDHGLNLRLGSPVAVDHRNIRGSKISVTDSTGEYLASLYSKSYAEPEKE